MPANLENSAVAMGLQKVSFHSNPKEGQCQTLHNTTQLGLFHLLVRFYSKSFKLDFVSIWTENFQMYKLGFKKAVNQCQIYLNFDYAKAFDFMDHNKLWEILTDGNTRPPDLPLEKPVCRSGSNS